MELITSRKNKAIVHMKRLCADRNYRRMHGEFVCEGKKLLREALTANAEITRLFVSEKDAVEVPGLREQYAVKDELAGYISALKNSPGPVFSVRIRKIRAPRTVIRAIILDGVADPGNTGTVIRTAEALKVDAVVLIGACADPYGPKAVRATMGAIFRQYIIETDIAGLAEFLRIHGLKLLGAEAAPGARDIRETELKNAAVAVGNEGGGISGELRELCGGFVAVPINPDCESLNAAVAAAVIMWEGCR